MHMIGTVQHIHPVDLEDDRFEMANGSCFWNMRARRFLKNTGRTGLLSMANESVALISPKWGCCLTCCHKKGILLCIVTESSNVNLQRTTRTKISTRRTAEVDLIMHSWLTNLQVLTQWMLKTHDRKTCHILYTDSEEIDGGYGCFWRGTPSEGKSQEKSGISKVWNGIEVNAGLTQVICCLGINLLLLGTLPAVNDQDDADMFDVNTLTGDEVLAESKVDVKDVNLIVDEVTLAQALAALKSVKPKVKANVVEEPSVPLGRHILQQQSNNFSRNASRAQSLGHKAREINGTKKTCDRSMKKKDLVRLDEEIASKLQAKSKNDAGSLHVELKKEKSTLAAKKSKMRREQTTNQAQQEKYQCKMFDKAFKRVNTFVDFIIDLVEGSSKSKQELELENRVSIMEKQKGCIVD
ncbi:hypothetical protein Tco_1351571 [Tanacetum coccineum]